jgi:hypothetical protein
LTEATIYQHLSQAIADGLLPLAAVVRLPEANHGMGRPSQWLQSNLAVIDWYNRFKTSTK